MKGRVASLLLAGCAIAIALPVIGQQRATEPQVPASETDAPRTSKSLLPDDFDAPTAPVADVILPGAVTTPTPDAAAPTPLVPGTTMPVIEDSFAAPASGGDLRVTGPLKPEAGGFGLAAFSGSNGRFVAGLANRLAAPTASRWAAITLRRALMSESATPWGIVPGDWVAARAGALLRMGEIDGAKLLVDAIPVDRYSPALYRVAADVALASADVAALCPIARTGRALFQTPLWELSFGMCAGIEGDDITAATIFDSLDDGRRVDRFDVRLGERIATMAGGAGRASNMDWNEAPALTRYRFGVATAAGVAVPADRLAALGPARFGWLVRIPTVSAEIRLAALRPAAMTGSLSAAELVSAVAALSPGDAADDSRAGLLRNAFAGSDRRAALQAIWASDGTGDSYGARIETAPVVARWPITSADADLSADMIAALLAMGDQARARRWWPVADQAGGAVRARAWALLAVGQGNVPISADEFRDWRSETGADDRHAALLLAGLTGLGVARGSDWEGLRDDLLPATANSWVRAIGAAAAAGRSGEVAVLAATGLQGRWIDVPPQHLYLIVAALTRVGRVTEARLIAAEAVTRG